MVMKMNKSEFIEKLENELSYSKEKCTIINEILEDNFFISKKSKDIILPSLMSRLNIGMKEALNIYDVAVSIINKEIINKLKHPFKSKD